MSDKQHDINVLKFLDDIAIDSMTNTEDQLRSALLEDGIDPDKEIQNLKSVASEAIAKYRLQKYESLPDEVPENPIEVAALFEKLLSFPGIQKESYTLAFREKFDDSEKDQRVITENLLRLLKMQIDA
jgi:hypothetical protein